MAPPELRPYQMLPVACDTDSSHVFLHRKRDYSLLGGGLMDGELSVYGRGGEGGGD